MRIWSAILIVCYCLFTSATCEQPFDVGDIDTEEKVLVNSIFSPDSVMQVEVSHSLSILSSPSEAPRPVAGVEVEVTNEGGEVTTLELQGEGPSGKKYYSNPVFKPEIGANYGIIVTSYKYGTAFSSSIIPVPTSITSVAASDLYREKSREFGRTDQWMTLNFKLPQHDDKKYYHLYISREKIFYNDNPNQGAPNIINTNTFVHNNLINFNNPNGLVYFDNSILIEGETIGFGQNFSVDVGFTFQPSFELVKHIRFELRTVSEEYYKYHTSLRKQSFNLQDSFAEPTILFNNIENGVGLFGGYSMVLDSLVL